MFLNDLLRLYWYASLFDLTWWWGKKKKVVHWLMNCSFIKNKWYLFHNPIIFWGNYRPRQRGFRVDAFSSFIALTFIIFPCFFFTFSEKEIIKTPCFLISFFVRVMLVNWSWQGATTSSLSCNLMVGCCSKQTLH